MKRVPLIARSDMNLGEVGLMCKAVKMIDTPMVTLQGSLIAHDILEHQNGLRAIGSIGDELEALGGVWYVRGQHGVLNPQYRGWYTPEQGIASDVYRLFELYHENNIPVRAEVERLHDECVGIDYIIDEFEHIVRQNAYEDDPQRFVNLREFSHHAYRLMTRGFQKARRRFGDDAQFANRQFWAIAEAIDDCIGGELWEDQEFTLMYGLGEARCIEKEIGYDDW